MIELINIIVLFSILIITVLIMYWAIRFLSITLGVDKKYFKNVINKVFYSFILLGIVIGLLTIFWINGMSLIKINNIHVETKAELPKNFECPSTNMIKQINERSTLQEKTTKKMHEEALNINKLLLKEALK